MRSIESIMTRSPVIPVIVVDNIEDAVPLARALCEGGLLVLEVTLRTQHGLQAISDIKDALPDAIIGAGTVVTPEDIQQSVNAGAEFLVSPGSTPRLIDAALAQSIPLLPGINTSSEAMYLLERGINHMKFFPAEAAGGVPMLKSIAGPLPQIKFCPTGGVTPQNAMNYLSLENVLCVGGSWMMNKTEITKKNWSAIRDNAIRAAKLVKNTKGGEVVFESK